MALDRERTLGILRHFIFELHEFDDVDPGQAVNFDPPIYDEALDSLETHADDEELEFDQNAAWDILADLFAAADQDDANDPAYALALEQLEGCYKAPAAS